ncbi:MAG: hypothetical protein WBA97_37745 [Actinophytocola sp.]|uniref:hypothetical protein n=1 Tax=Actinophytocola sp. TaxID=1872138 RepID=UPI003C758FBA
MTHDITRGLSLLANEAEPAPIDSHTVIQLAHAHRRARRAVYTATFATLVAIGALTVAIGSWQDPTATGPATSRTTEPAPASSSADPASSSADPPPTTQDSPTTVPNAPEVQEDATPEENAERKPRLQTEMIAAFDRILPASWQHSAFGFGCDGRGCFAEGDVIDDNGTTLGFFVYVSDKIGEVTCAAGSCVRTEVLDDGTAVALSKGDENSVYIVSERPDRTGMHLSVDWPADKPKPEITEDQWLEFGRAFTY